MNQLTGLLRKELISLVEVCFVTYCVVSPVDFFGIIHREKKLY